jgi:hypothetical protein
VNKPEYRRCPRTWGLLLWLVSTVGGVGAHAPAELVSEQLPVWAVPSNVAENGASYEGSWQLSRLMVRDVVSSWRANVAAVTGRLDESSECKTANR